ncbi:MAG TPA: NAD(P)/FAD-dependent oxidoreductase [Polyangiaceae bacterium]|nr:NAD(P)/FAD-dependent oxidoreductase [Polyangiaceae bacterium]
MSNTTGVSSLHADVAVVGAGPTGSAAALAFARRGARVALIDGHPEAARRFAGEWIHPPGVRTLAALGVATESLASAVGHGFALFGDDGNDPVCLPYASGSSVARVHHEIVAALREHACAAPGVTYLPYHVFSALEGNTLRLDDRKRGRSIELTADRVIGADGRSSKVRDCLGAPSDSQLLSYMAGVELHDVELPFEGMGHVFVGGPGPALVYRIDAGRARACLDVPHATPTNGRRGDALYRAFSGAFPAQLRAALGRALEGRVAWASTRYRPRNFHGRGHVWLAGDAIGHLHPLSGVGLTLGVMDAVAAAEAPDLASYRRNSASHVVELLSNVLYLAFARHDESAIRIRHGLLRMLRAEPLERRRTIRLLAGEDRAATSFASSFLRATGRVVVAGLEKTATRRQTLGEWSRHLRQDAAWLKWPLDACVPPAGSLRRVAAPQASFREVIASTARTLRAPS